MNRNNNSGRHFSLKKGFWFFALLNVIFIGFSYSYLQPVSLGDILQLEVAGTEAEVIRVLGEFSMVAGKTEKALEAVYLDFVFIFLYTTALAFACLYLPSLTKNTVFIRAGKFFAFLLIAVFACDMIENFALLKTLNGVIDADNILLTYNMAVAKFSMLIMIFLFLIISPVLTFNTRHKEMSFASPGSYTRTN